MKRTLTLKYNYSGDQFDHYREVKQEYDIEDYALTDDELLFIEENMYDLIPDPPDGQYHDYEEFIWDDQPWPKGTGENPPESAWFDFYGRQWASDGVMLIAADQPIRIHALRRWKDVETINMKKVRDVFADFSGAFIHHPGYFDISFKPFNTPLHKVLSVDGSMESAGYVFECSSDRLVAIIMPIDRKDGHLNASVFRFVDELVEA